MARDLEAKRTYNREYHRKRRAADPERLRAYSQRIDARYRERHAEQLAIRRRARRRVFAEWLDGYRRSHGCVDCGTREGPLHFDHRDDETKLFTIADGGTVPRARLEAEIAKCDIRCASCHGKRHAAKRRRERQPMVAMVHALLQAGLSRHAIARETGIPLTTVCRWLKIAGAA
jgi:hypothetical protein